MNNLPIYEWEYDQIQASHYNFISHANTVGKKGWELVSGFSIPGTDRICGIFKRPKIFGVSITKNE